jgi:hypothetical protein
MGAKFYAGGASALSCESEENFEVCGVTTVPFAREPLPKLALFGSPSPPGYTSLHAEVQRVPYRSHIPARQSCPGAALVPVAPHSLRITPCRANGGGQSSVRVFGPGVLIDIRESNPRHGPDQSGLQGRSVQVFSLRGTSCTKTGIPALSSSLRLGALSVAKFKHICEQF